jgi:uncharacterized protein YyaL (SSP411 family)
MNVLRARYLPFAVVVPLTGIRDSGFGIRRVLPWTEPMMRDAPTAYVCRDFTCQAPATSAEQFAAQLGRPS